MPRNKLQRLIGYNIFLKRKEKNMIQADLAQALSVSRPAIVNIEKGNQGVSLEQLLKLSLIFDCPIDCFFPTKDEYKPKFKL